MTVDRIIKVLSSHEPHFDGGSRPEVSLDEILFWYFKGYGATATEAIDLAKKYLDQVAEKLHTEIERQQKSVPFAVNTAGRIPE